MATDKDSEILVKLGILSNDTRVPSSPSRGGSPLKSMSSSNKNSRSSTPAGFEEVVMDDNLSLQAVTASEGEGSDSEQDIIFDSAALLQGSSGRRPAPGSRTPFWSVRKMRNRREGSETGSNSLVCMNILVCTAFFSLGLNYAIIGPTVPDIQTRIGAPHLVSVIGAVTASGFGALLGITFGSLLYACVNPFLLISIALAACSLITLSVAWCTALSSVQLLMFIQGFLMGTVERGGFSLFFIYWPNKHHILHLYYAALAVGAFIAPLITTPFVFDNVQPTLQRTIAKYGPVTTTTTTTPSDGFLIVKREISESDEAVDILNTTLLSSALHNIDNNNSSNQSLIQSGPPPKKPIVAVSDETNPNKSLDKLVVKGDRSSSGDGSDDETESKEAISENEPMTQSAEGGQSQSTPSGSATTTSSTTTTTTTTTTVSVSSSTEYESGAAEDTGDDKPGDVDESEELKPLTAPENSDPAFPRQSYWDLLQQKVVDVNRTQLAYAVIATISLLTTLTYLFAFLCCCVSCKTTTIVDHGYNPGRLCRMRDNRMSLILALVFISLVSSIDSTLTSLLTVYMLKRQHKLADRAAMMASDDGDSVTAMFSQASAVALTSLFWFGMAVSRISTTAARTLFSSTKMLFFLLCTAAISMSVLAVFGNGSEAVLFSFMIVLGLCVGPIFPLAFTWMDRNIGMSPWSASLWLISAALGKIVFPVFTAYFVEAYSSRLLLLMTLIITLLASVVFIFLQKVVKVASQIRIAEQSKQLANGHATYNDAFGEQDQQGDGYSRLETRTLELDDFGFDDDNVIHYDKTSNTANGPAASNEGAFAKYGVV